MPPLVIDTEPLLVEVVLPLVPLAPEKLPLVPPLVAAPLISTTVPLATAPLPTSMTVPLVAVAPLTPELAPLTADAPLPLVVPEMMTAVPFVRPPQAATAASMSVEGQRG
jgi:hypothetical protein